jgi:hypothetical protein
MARGTFTSQPIALDMVHDGRVFRESDNNLMLIRQIDETLGLKISGACGTMWHG